MKKLLALAVAIGALASIQAVSASPAEAGGWCGRGYYYGYYGGCCARYYRSGYFYRPMMQQVIYYRAVDYRPARLYRYYRRYY
jgi:hypothetical protein